VLKIGGETDRIIEDLIEIKETGISIARFTETIERSGFCFEQKDLWFINPNYEIKFGLKPMALPGIIEGLPWVKDFFATCCYALVRKA
jgi:hypothetical protein